MITQHFCKLYKAVQCNLVLLTTLAPVDGRWVTFISLCCNKTNCIILTTIASQVNLHFCTLCLWTNLKGLKIENGDERESKAFFFLFFLIGISLKDFCSWILSSFYSKEVPNKKSISGISVCLRESSNRKEKRVG